MLILPLCLHRTCDIPPTGDSPAWKFLAHMGVYCQGQFFHHQTDPTPNHLKVMASYRICGSLQQESAQLSGSLAPPRLSAVCLFSFQCFLRIVGFSLPTFHRPKENGCTSMSHSPSSSWWPHSHFSFHPTPPKQKSALNLWSVPKAISLPKQGQRCWLMQPWPEARLNWSRGGRGALFTKLLKGTMLEGPS